MSPLFSVPFLTPTTPRSLQGTSGSPPSIEWDESYGAPEFNDFGYDVQATRDQGYVIAGYTASYGESGDMWLIKTDEMGKEQWNTSYGTAFADTAYSVKQTSDQGYILSGQTLATDSAGDVFVVKTDRNGTELWNFTYGELNLQDFGNTVIETADHDYLIVGTTQLEYLYGNYSGKVLLLNLHENGTIHWIQTIGGDIFDGAYAVDQTADNGFIIAGYIHFPMPPVRNTLMHGF